MLVLRTSAICQDEKNYVFKIIFGEFLNLDYEISFDDQIDNTIISLATKKLIVSDVFFQQFKTKEWLSEESVPKLPLQKSNLLTQISSDDANTVIPILFGEDKIEVSDDQINIGIDIFGACFFMLSRYEELIIKDKDEHGRFPVSSSVAFKEKFLEIPIVDIYVEILCHYLKKINPSIRFKKIKSATILSCDVDFFYDRGVQFPNIIKRIGKNILLDKSPTQAISSFNVFWQTHMLGNRDKDPFNTFEYMMDICEERGLKMAFYFIPLNNKQPIDGDYDIDSKQTLQLMKKIINRGHEVGYHGSYDSYKNSSKSIEEVDLLKRVYQKAGGNPEDIKGGRQHYLRWETGVTELNWEEAGLRYDSTLGYAEHIGFRCGTSREYSFYSLLERRMLHMKIRPLLVMEVTLFEKKYMALDDLAYKKEVDKVKYWAKRYGNYTLLWHNSSLSYDKMRQALTHCI